MINHVCIKISSKEVVSVAPIAMLLAVTPCDGWVWSILAIGTSVKAVKSNASERTELYIISLHNNI